MFDRVPRTVPVASLPAGAIAAVALSFLISTATVAGAQGAESPSEEPVAEASASSDTAAPAPPAAESPAIEEGVVIFARVMVVGGLEESARLPGSSHFVSAAELDKQNQSDIHRILHQVPGINVQEEEGFGLRPNIGMRGTGVERSSKITLLEDGVLIAPAPYAAPAAYYFPTAGRMEAIEVRKGSSSIRQGPHTNGGVLNLVSSSIPSGRSFSIQGAAGEHGTRRLRASAGESRERFGWLAETYQLASDGFKRIDGGGDSGVDLEDYLVKLRFGSRSTAPISQSLELKLGATDQEGDETYLGLTDADFRLDPYRRYAASRDDHISTDHEQVVLRHFLRPRSGSFDLTTTAYRNDFFRNWRKLESVAGTSVSRVLRSPEVYADQLALLRAETDSTGGPLDLRNNRRDYYSQGVESILAFSQATSRAQHTIEIGVRYHEDEEDRFQEEDRFDVVGGELVLAALGAPGSQANRVADAQALALFVQDRIAFDRWTVTPGVRFESIDFSRLDYGRNDPSRSGVDAGLRRNGVDVVIPGLGVVGALSDSWSVFAGVHKGFSPPSPGQDDRAKAEESVNHEIGLRYARNGTRLQLVGFFNDYENLLGTDTLSSGGGGTGDQFNGGEVEVLGLEASLRTDLGERLGGRFQVPLRLSYTYTQAEFQTSFATSFADWAPRVEAGDELPYLPEQQGALGLGLVARRFALHATLSYSARMRTSAGQGPLPAGEGTDERWIVDVAGELEILSRLRGFMQIRNLTDEVDVVARRPAGLRPGLPRTALVGLKWEL